MREDSLGPSGAAAGPVRFGRFSAEDLRAAADAPDRNGLTRVARALQKHAGREGSVFSRKFDGTPAERNAAAKRVLDEIMNDPKVRTTTGSNVTDIRDSTNRGVRFSNDGKFMGFLEPR
ncbi:MAG TPA: hypothetical protein VFE65_18370 [Pseudonocardia sp.]|jgi:filamentous hemagglutinin|nr:hypothetical protein [Pseudonocardia sp.]